MVKVLAAEMSDPQRLRRGKQYAHDGSVTDIIIEPGVVTCEIQGSRPTPYIASVEVTPGDGMPVRRDITAHCSCPDDDNWDDRACKHVVAAMFAFSDELLIEPELLDVWRGREPGSSSSRVPRTNRRPTARPAPIPICASCTPYRAAPAAVMRPANSRSSPTFPMSPRSSPTGSATCCTCPRGPSSRRSRCSTASTSRRLGDMNSVPC